MIITSIRNEIIKEIRNLSTKSSHRKQQNRFVIEGRNEIKLAIKGGIKFDKILYCQEILQEAVFLSIAKDLECEVVKVNKNVYEKIAYRDNTEGIIAIAFQKKINIYNLKISEKPFFIILDNIENPGNLGAIIRTADAIGIDAVFVTNSKIDIYNPNTIRTSLGAIFTNNVLEINRQELYEFLKSKSIYIYATYLKASVFYHTIDYTKPSCIIMGAEHSGLDDFWLDKSNTNIIIPMKGNVNSINVSVSTAIIAFESARQRHFL